MQTVDMELIQQQPDGCLPDVDIIVGLDDKSRIVGGLNLLKKEICLQGEVSQVLGSFTCYAGIAHEIPWTRKSASCKHFNRRLAAYVWERQSLKAANTVTMHSAAEIVPTATNIQILRQQLRETHTLFAEGSRCFDALTGWAPSISSFHMSP